MIRCGRVAARPHCAGLSQRNVPRLRIWEIEGQLTYCSNFAGIGIVSPYPASVEIREARAEKLEQHRRLRFCAA
jgi:hypothetical protein